MKLLTKIFQALLGVVALMCTTVVAAGRLAIRTLRNWWRGGKKWLCYVIGFVVVGLLLGYVGCCAYSNYQRKHERWEWYDQMLSKRVAVHHFLNDTYRVYDKKSGTYTTDNIDWVSDAAEGDSLAVYAQAGKRGFLNVNTGSIVIDAQENNYTKAWVFSEGLAAVVSDDKIGFINPANQVVIPFVFDCPLREYTFAPGHLFYDGRCAMTNSEGKVGFIDTSGKWVIEPTYDQVWAPHKSGYRVVIANGMYGILDMQCRVVYDAKYDYIDILDEGILLTAEGHRWQVDFEGRVVNPFIYDESEPLGYPAQFNEYGDVVDAFSTYAKYRILDRYGVMDCITGKVITPAIYHDVSMISEVLFEVAMTPYSDYALIDQNGNIIGD